MKAAFPFFHSPVFRKFMLSFLAAFLLPLSILFSYVFFANKEVLTNEIYAVQRSTVNQIQRSMDFEYERYRTFATMLMGNVKINRLRRMPYDAMTPSDTLHLMDLRGVMSSFCASTSGVAKAFLYMPQNGICIDATRALPIADVLYVMEDLGLVPNDEVLWKNMLENTFRSQWLRTVNAKSQQVIYFIQTIPSVFDSDTCNLMIAISAKYLQRIFDATDLTQGEWIGMLDEKGSLLYSPLQDQPSIDIAAFAGNSGRFEQDSKLYTFSRSALTNNLFLSVLPITNINSSLNRTLSISFLILLVSFFICAIITYLTTVNNFKPIAYLNTLAKIDDDDVADTDEFTRLRIALMDAADEKRLRLDRVRHSREILDDQALFGDLAKAPSQALLDKRLQREGLTKVGNAWLLCIVTLVDFSDEGVDPQATFQQTIAQLHDSFSTVVTQSYTVLPLYDDKDLLVLINLPSNELHHLAYLRNALTNLLHLLRSNFSIDCQVGVSAIHSQPSLCGDVLSSMLVEARIAADSPAESESIFFYSTQEVDKVLHVSVEHTMHRLMHACLRGSSGDTAKLLEQLTTQINTLTAQQSQKEGDVDVDEGDSTEMRIKRSILEIVKNEYPNPMLNVSAIADQLGKNVDYISRVFKQTTTIGLLDYIHHMRIKASKELLRTQPALSVAQIAQRVGYIGTDSFIRAFKRIEGTTPGRFRTQLHNKE